MLFYLSQKKKPLKKEKKFHSLQHHNFNKHVVFLNYEHVGAKFVCHTAVRIILEGKINVADCVDHFDFFLPLA